MSNIGMVEAKLPPGFRFHPRDEELVCDYLMKKLTHHSHYYSSLLIDLDLNKCEPWDIPERACVGGKEWYFYTQRDRKYATGLRTNRATASGYWKATGKDREVLRKGSLVGMRKTLVFYHGRAPKGKKTDWVMHEFRIQPSLIPSLTISSPKEDWVLCRVFYKNREEIVKGSMGSIYDDTVATASSSSHLPQLMDSFISFEHPSQPPPPHDDEEKEDDHHYYEQVPCFSNLSSHHHHHLLHDNKNQTNPTYNNNNFNHMMMMMTMDHPNLGSNAQKNLNNSNNNNIDATTTFGGGTLSLISSNCSLDPSSSCDKKVLKAVLTQLTKMEPNPTHQHHPSHTNNHFSHLSIPTTLWNNF